MKETILERLRETLQSVGLIVTSTPDADIQAEGTFLDATWTSSKKPVEYKILVSADVRDQSVYFYETLDGQNENITGKKVKRIVTKPFGSTEIVRLEIGDISKKMRSAIDEDGWKVKSVNNPQKVAYAQGGFALVEPPSDTIEIEIPKFKPSTESETFEPIVKTYSQRTELPVFYLGEIVVFVLFGMILNTQTYGYFIGLAVWLIFLLFNRKYREDIPLRVVLWILCGALLLSIAYFTLAH